MSQCVWMLIQILRKKNSLITLARKIKGEEQDEEAILSLEDIQLFLKSRGCLQDAMQVGNFMDNLSAVQDSHCKTDHSS